MVTCKERFLLDQEFVVEYNIITAIYIPPITFKIQPFHSL